MHFSALDGFADKTFNASIFEPGRNLSALFVIIKWLVFFHLVKLRTLQISGINQIQNQNHYRTGTQNDLSPSQMFLIPIYIPTSFRKPYTNKPKTAKSGPLVGLKILIGRNLLKFKTVSFSENFVLLKLLNFFKSKRSDVSQYSW